MKIEREKAIAELAHLRFKLGYSRLSLVNYLKETYDLATSRAYELIREMYDEMSDVYDELHVDALKDSIEFLESMKQKALGQGNDKLALEITKELNKIQQLHVQKIELQAKMEQPLFGSQSNGE